MSTTSISEPLLYWQEILESFQFSPATADVKSVSALASQALTILTKAKEDVTQLTSNEVKLKQRIQLAGKIKGSLNGIIATMRRKWIVEATNIFYGNPTPVREQLERCEEFLSGMDKLCKELRHKWEIIAKEQTVVYVLKQLTQWPKNRQKTTLSDFLQIKEECLEKSKLRKLESSQLIGLQENGIQTVADLVLMLHEGSINDDSIVESVRQHLTDYRSALKETTREALSRFTTLARNKPYATMWTQTMCARYGNMTKIDALTLEELNHLGLGTVQGLVGVISKMKVDEGEQILNQPWPMTLTHYLSTQRERLQEIRHCAVEEVRSLLKHKPRPEQTQQWIAQLSRFYEIRPYVVREAICRVPLNDDLMREILKAIPLAFDPFPKGWYDLLSQYSYEEFNHIVGQAPYLFPAFPEQQRQEVFDRFQTDPTTTPQALIGLASYPLYWKHLFPKLNNSQIKRLLSDTPAMALIREGINYDKSEWDRFVEFLNQYPRGLKDPIKTVQRIKSFFRLGPHQWKLWVDPKYYHLGPEVFDLGLHDHDQEPGYLDRMRAAAIYLCSYLEVEKQDPDDWWRMYSRVHDIATPISDLMTTRSTHAILQGRPIVTMNVHGNEVNRFLALQPEEQNAIIKEINAFASQFPDTQLEFVPSLEELVARQAPDRLCLDWEVKMVWKGLYGDQLKNVYQLYHKKMNAVDFRGMSKNEKVRHIAILHQQRERHHLFMDGNSRTNWLIAQYDLVKNDLAPSAFDPNKSYFESEDSWAKVVENGERVIDETYS